jgi:hypothetical protein
MQEISKYNSFKNFELTKMGMNQTLGGRTRRFEEQEGRCLKIIDDNTGGTTKKKLKSDDRCD